MFSAGEQPPPDLPPEKTNKNNPNRANTKTQKTEQEKRLHEDTVKKHRPKQKQRNNLREPQWNSKSNPWRSNADELRW
jgi:hypothetical protein